MAKSKRKAAGRKKQQEAKATNEKKKTKSQKPTFKWDMETGEKVWYTTVTLSEIKKAKKTGDVPNSKGKKQLVRIPSHETRQQCYRAAAEAIASWEEELLPTYGGRKWTVSVQLDEPQGKKTPLFRWFRGELELAVLPHLLEDIPYEEPIEQKGVAKLQELEQEEKHVPATALSERQVSFLSEFAYNDDEHGIPIVTLKWMSPNHEVFRTRAKAQEHAELLVQQELFLDKVLDGFGARGQALRPTKATKNDALKAGRLRFIRDGLWVIGQEDLWQEERAEEMEQKAEEKKQEEAMLERERKLAGSKVQGLEHVALGKERALAGSKVQDLQVHDKKKKPLSTLAYFLQCRRKDYRTERLAELNKSARKSGPATLTLREAETELRNVWKTMSKKEQNVWKKKADEAKELLLKEQEATRSKKEQVSVGESKAQDSSSSGGNEKQEGQVVTEPEASTNENARNVENTHPPVAAAAVAPTMEPATEALAEDSSKELVTLSSPAGEMPVSTVPNPKPTVEESAAKPASPQTLGGLDHPVVTAEESEGEDSKSASSGGEVQQQVQSTATVVLPAEPDASISTEPDNKVATTGKCRRPLSKCPPRRFGQANHWRMAHGHIDICYEAVMDHYDQVMNTVKARGLNFELADGFDVLRERGRGRYDMELPVFDTPKFDFLTSLDRAPWMPVVREILGQDVVLIHKGAFLSMPGAATQVYHQDGLHLTTKIQRPCHAVNVFVPLVDLHLQNGPTEFCLGSHILGNEDYDKATVHIPTAPAGTPIIFDYRLGHRGLANTSPYCRPIVYCTYAAAKDGKQFRDSINFSRKRYHKIGQLVEKPLSREERTKKRKLAQEEQKLRKMVEEEEVAANEIKTDDDESGVEAEKQVAAGAQPLAELGAAPSAYAVGDYKETYAAVAAAVAPLANNFPGVAASMSAGATTTLFAPSETIASRTGNN